MKRKNKGAYVFEWFHSRNSNGSKLLPPLEILNQLFIYNEATGELFRKYSILGGDIEPRLVETISSSGYILVSIIDSLSKEALYKVHRICYFMQTGVDPMENSIDHINGLTTDNRFENLRIVSHKVNSRNKKMQHNNTSGFNGVSWNKRYRKWEAQIRINNKKKYLGYYDTIEEAIAARETAIIEFNRQNPLQAYSERHGT
jgi:hypothetical protein